MLLADWKRHSCLVVYLWGAWSGFHSLLDLQPECRFSADSPEFPDGYNLLFLTSLFDFIPSTDYVTADIDLLKALWTYDNNPKASDL